MGQSNYTEKFMSLLSSNQFILIPNDAIKSMESKVQRTLRKIKLKLSEQECKKLYPTGSCQGQFYRTAKIYKLPVNGGINELPIRPIVSNLTLQHIAYKNIFLSYYHLYGNQKTR